MEIAIPESIIGTLDDQVAPFRLRRELARLPPRG